MHNKIKTDTKEEGIKSLITHESSMDLMYRPLSLRTGTLSQYHTMHHNNSNSVK